MANIRPAVFARMGWYPDTKEECIKLIRQWSSLKVDAKTADIKGMGGIVPHAGWYFSGEIACQVYTFLSKAQPDIVVVFGKHLSVSSPRSIMVDGLWETPLGDIRIESEIASVLVDEYDFVVETCSRFEEDNTIEVQLPFIKYFFPEARLLPMGMPPTPESLDIARRTGALCMSKGLKVIAVGSTDLTHYGPNYGFMPAGFGEKALKWAYHNDERVIKRMCAMDAFGVIEEALAHHNACCPGACASAITMAKKMGAVRGEALVYGTSYDKSPGSSFVGYVGLVF